MSTAVANVNTPCTAYSQMAAKWGLLHDLLGGTATMRAAGTKWLPKETQEDRQHYNVRLERSILFNAYGDTVEKLAAKPFSRPVTIQGDLPQRLAPLVDDVDGTGRSLTQFAKDAFRMGLIYGMVHILVDYPRAPRDIDLATERQLALRPRPVLVSPADLIGWTVDKDSSGRQVLSSIRIREQDVVPLGEYGEQIVERVRVYRPDDWQLWELGEKDWMLIDSDTHSYPGIPLTTCYFLKKDFMIADPPLEALAWLNLAHWQSMSDQRNILRYARSAILFASGFTKQEVDAGITLGPNSFVHSTNPEADLKYVEHAGAAIEAGESDLKRLEERMEILGMQPLIRQSGDVKATGQAINEAKSQAEIQAWIRDLEAALYEMFSMSAVWIGANVPDDFMVDIYSDFAMAGGSNNELAELLKARLAGQIRHATYLYEMKRRGVLSEMVDVGAEVTECQSDGNFLLGE